MKRDVVEKVPMGSSVLEIGLGTGELALMLAARDCRIFGFDSSRGMVRVAKARVEAEGLTEVVTVRHMGVEQMDQLDADSFDVVASTLVFSELSNDERRYALRHAARALKPDGLIVIADEVVPRSTMNRLLHDTFRIPALVLTYVVTGSRTTPIPDLAGELDDSGFVIVSEERSHGDAFALIVGRRSGIGEVSS